MYTTYIIAYSIIYIAICMWVCMCIEVCAPQKICILKPHPQIGFRGGKWLGLTPKNWCFWTVVLEKTLESLLNYKEIQQVHPKGNQSQIFIGRTDAEAETLILWPLDAGKDWRQEEKGTTEDEMVGWHHQHDGLEFEWTPEVGYGQGGLVCCSPWDGESDTTERLNWTELKWLGRWG